MAAAAPKFEIGDRAFSHYVMKWGTVESISHTTEPTRHGVTGSMLPGSTWYHWRPDGASRTELLDDADGNWDLARLIPPAVARRFGYGADPKAT